MTGLLSVAGSTPSEGFELKSVRFNDDDSAYMSRTNTVVGNRKTWILSFWTKLANRASGNHSVQMLFKAGASGQNSIDALFSVKLNPDMIQVSSNNDIVLKTNRLFRDPAAWYHMMFVMDTTQATAANRFKIYINGVRETSFATDNISTYVTHNLDTAVNNTVLTQFGFDDDTTYTDGYQAEAYLLDGSAVGPEYFGETNALTNQWQPLNPTDITPTVTFGTNGFYLPFSNDALATNFTDIAGNAPVAVSFTSSTTWTVPTGVTSVDVLVVGGAGGGGGSWQGPGSGGAGGGGTGARHGPAVNATAGTANTGGGGGAGADPAATGGAGGKGVVILSVPTINYSGTTTGSPTVTTSGSNKIIQFNGDGSYTT